MDFRERAVPIPLGRILRWGVFGWITGERSRPKPVPAPRVREALQALEETSPPSLTWIGHATVLIRMNGTAVLVDPNWHRAGTVRRLVRPGIALGDLPPIGVVALSHNHYDHFSTRTLEQLAHRRPQPLAVAPLGLGRALERAGFRDIVELDWWDHTEREGVTIRLVPARHWSRRSLFDTNRTLWGGYVFSGERTVYFAGDTARFEGFREIGERSGPLDVALLPIGAYEPEWFMRPQHLTPEDAGEAFLDSGARLLAAIHWGTYVLADEATDAPPRRLETWWNQEKRDGREIWIPAIGETRGL